MSRHISTWKVAQEQRDLKQPPSVWLYYSTQAETVEEASHMIFGHTLADEVYAKLLDVRTGEIVRICISHFEYASGFILPLIRIKLFRAIKVGAWSGMMNVEYAITHNGSTPQLLLLKFRVPQEAQKKGLATHMFAAHVQAAQTFDFPLIHAYADGGSGSEAGNTRNGYYTWPRLGFDTRLTAAEKARLPVTWRHFTFLSEIMEQPGGREWWLEHGFALEMTFDISPHSRSMQRLQTALAALQHKHGYWISNQNGPFHVQRGPSMYPPSYWRQRVWSYRTGKQSPINPFGSTIKEIPGCRTTVAEPCV